MSIEQEEAWLNDFGPSDVVVIDGVNVDAADNLLARIRGDDKGG